MKSHSMLFVLCFFALAGLFSSCSINRMATKAVANALTGTGSSEVFTGDPDPELVGDALPFAIKMYEALLSTQPDHQGLILTTGSLFVMYANAFVQGPAEMLPLDRNEERKQAQERAKKFYLRGAAILYDGLEKKYPGFKEAAAQDASAGNAGDEDASAQEAPAQDASAQGAVAQGAAANEALDKYLAKMKKEDVPLLYWAVAGLLSAYSLDVFDFDLGFRLPELSAMIHRAYELDPDFNNGALDDFFILFYAQVPEGLGGNPALVQTHFERAVEKSGGKAAGPYVSYAASVSIPAQDYKTFRDCLEKALAIDPEEDPQNRLVNVLNQRKAQYLLDNEEELFLVIPWDD
jgi:predicted anti-sigma-YlaC factor YlaD